MKKDVSTHKRLFNRAKEYNTSRLSEHLLEISALYELSSSFNFTVSMEEIIQKSDALLRKTLGLDDFCIMLVDEKTAAFSVLKAGGPESQKGDFFIKMGEGISGLVAEKGKTILVRNAATDPRFQRHKGRKKETGSFLCVPLKDHAGKVIGVFNIHKAKPGSFAKKETLFFEAAAKHIAGAIEKAQLFREIETKAIFDELTGLYSRRYFLTALEKTIGNSKRTAASFGLIMIDVDHFKEVNDQFGHQAGDDVLVSLGALVSDHIRKGDVAARYGGEEIIILTTEGGLEGAVTTAEKLRELTEKTIFSGTGASRRPVTISSGVAAFPDCGNTGPALIASADKALYLSKSFGRNQVRTHNDAQKPSPNERRKGRRFKVVIKRAYVENDGVKNIDISSGGRWMPCVLEDISDSGFKGRVTFKPRAGEIFSAKIQTLGKKGEGELLSFVCSNLAKGGDENYAVGMNIVGNAEIWRKYLTKIGV